MASTTHSLLEALLKRFDAGAGPVTLTELAQHSSSDRESVRERLDDLERYELVKRVSDAPGYRPTVTARELVDLDLDPDEFFILETSDDFDR